MHIFQYFLHLLQLLDAAATDLLRSGGRYSPAHLSVSFITVLQTIFSEK
jgi:hypothetical protein